MQAQKYSRMNYKAVYDKCKRLAVSPENEWKFIREENLSLGNIILKYVFPLLLLAYVASIVGNVVFYPLMKQPFAFISIKTAIDLLVNFAAMFVCGWLINEMSKNFGVEKNLKKVLTLIIYSYLAVFVTKAGANFFQNYSGIRLVFNLAAFYGLYLFWTGVPIILGIPNDKKMNFVALSVLLLLVVNITLNPVSNYILQLSTTALGIDTAITIAP